MCCRLQNITSDSICTIAGLFPLSTASVAVQSMSASNNCIDIDCLRCVNTNYRCNKDPTHEVR
jgi:hypothetical protein